MAEGKRKMELSDSERLVLTDEVQSNLPKCKSDIRGVSETNHTGIVNSDTHIGHIPSGTLLAILYLCLATISAAMITPGVWPCSDTDCPAITTNSEENISL